MAGGGWQHEFCQRAVTPVAGASAGAALAVLIGYGVDPIGWAAGIEGGARQSLVDATLLACMLLAGSLLLVLACRVRRLNVEIVGRRAAESAARALAGQDPLTGLPNRRVLKEEVEWRLAGIWPGLDIAVLLIDLDDFKIVNDVHGHAVGDAVLRIAAERMRGALSFGTMLFRLAGDEFAVLVPYSLQHRVREEAQAILAAMRHDIAAGPLIVGIGVSVGIARAPTDATDPTALIWAADVAMYRAKQQGGNRVVEFEAPMGRAVREQARLKSEIRDAIETGRIVPYYQPIVDLRSGRIAEFEVLARWLHSEHGVVPPERFVDIVDSARLAKPMLLALLRQVARDCASWPPYLRFSINLLASQLRDLDLVPAICAALEASVGEASVGEGGRSAGGGRGGGGSGGGGLTPARLCLEVTETAQVADMATASLVAGAARRAGMMLALDDVGTGYSSLNLLRRLPFGRMKIDRSFVLSVRADADNAAYVDVLVATGRKLGLEIVAEGIETAELDCLMTDLACDYGQGHFYSKPVPASDVPDILARDAAGPNVPPLMAPESD